MLVSVLIEMPAGSHEKWEFDGSSWIPDGTYNVPLPFHYGFIQGSQAGAEEETDAFVIGEIPGERGTACRVHIAEMLLLDDQDGFDPKVVCVPDRDMSITSEQKKAIETFLAVVKAERGQTCRMRGWSGAAAAEKFIAARLQAQSGA